MYNSSCCPRTHLPCLFLHHFQYVMKTGSGISCLAMSDTQKTNDQRGWLFNIRGYVSLSRHRLYSLRSEPQADPRRIVALHLETRLLILNAGLVHILNNFSSALAILLCAYFVAKKTTLISCKLRKNECHRWDSNA